MPIVPVDRARIVAEPPVPTVEVTGRVVLDLTREPGPAPDDEFVVDWQISGPRPASVPGVPSPA